MLRAIGLKKNVRIVDVVSTRNLGDHGFFTEVFEALAEQSVSVDTIATSEIYIFVTPNGARRNDSYEEKQQVMSERPGAIAKVVFFRIG